MGENVKHTVHTFRDSIRTYLVVAASVFRELYARHPESPEIGDVAVSVRPDAAEFSLPEWLERDFGHLDVMTRLYDAADKLRESAPAACFPMVLTHSSTRMVSYSKGDHAPFLEPLRVSIMGSRDAEIGPEHILYGSTRHHHLISASVLIQKRLAESADDLIEWAVMRGDEAAITMAESADAAMIKCLAQDLSAGEISDLLDAPLSGCLTSPKVAEMRAYRREPIGNPDIDGPGI